MKIQKLSPILWTKDLNATISFYTDVLGFRGVQHFQNFVTLTKDDTDIMFIVPTILDDETKEPSDFFPKPVLTGSIYFFMDNIDEYWEKVKDKLVVKEPICDREYLMRDFSLLDNNGYEIVFGQDISGMRSD